jgi:hypothetical protein
VESGRDRSFRLFDSAWLDGTHQETDFSKGLDDWTMFATHGVDLQPDPANPSGRVLAVRKADQDWPAGAVWNFPIGAKGRLRIEFMLRPGFGGAVLGLTDHYSVPWDVEDVFFNVLNLPIPASGQVFPNLILTTGRWYRMTLDWDTGRGDYKLSLDGSPVGTLSDRHQSYGLNYLRIRSFAESPDAGLLVRSVSVDVEKVGAVPRDFNVIEVSRDDGK